MIPNVLLISKPSIELPTFLSLCEEVLGYSPARSADRAGLTGAPHLLACLTAFKDQDATPTVKGGRDVYNLIHFTFVVAADETDMAPILEAMNGMPFALTETRIRGVQVALVTGSLLEWKQAILRGCRQDQPEFIRVCFDKIYLQFQHLGLADAFGRLTKKAQNNGVFYLEDQR
jgi:hypothetical protein